MSRRGFLKGAAAGSGAMAVDLSALSDLVSAAPSAVSVENQKTGTDEWWIGELDDTIEGFATQWSVNAGTTVQFKIRTNARSYRIDILRLGWYGGAGATKVTSFSPSATLPQSQPTPYTDSFTGLVDCSNWAVSASWAVPSTAVSGVYVANLVRLDTGGTNRIMFVVRNDNKTSDILVQTSDSTYHAYNTWGGNSLYQGSANWGRAVKVSYDRPMGNTGLENDFFYAEFPAIRWLERNGYDCTYFSDWDAHVRGAQIKLHKVYLTSGHDEYWSGPQRAAVEAARDAGVNLFFMTGNEVFWRTRFEPNRAGTADRTLVCYKETLEGAKIDPTSEWTGTWRDARFSPPSNGGRPENQLTGTLFRAINPNYHPDFAIKVPYEYSRMRLWRNTSVASLTSTQTAQLTDATLGYEWDTDEDNGFRPAGLIRLSQTTETADQVLQDEGGNYITAPLTHYLTQYKAPSGALVFATGTCQWSWGLDDNHENSPNVPIPVDLRIQQATMNVLADMGVQPSTKQSDLFTASKSTDVTPPTSTITAPASGATVPVGSSVTVTGTAADVGGQVAAVEVSTDNGATWHPAVGRTSWSYTFTPTALGALTIRVRAVDDSCNIQTTTTSRSITVGARTLPCSIWNSSVVPALPAANDSSAVELGVKFRAATDGFITAIRFYKGTGNTGTHVGRVWSASGQQLATATFANETATGWQQANLSSPVTVTAGTTYVVSYFAPNGHYAADNGYFSKAFDVAPLRALANGEDGPNGVYRAGSSGFPTDTYGATNYWVDIVFDNDNRVAPTVVDRSPAINLEAVALTSSVSVTFSEGMNASSIALGLKGPGGVAVAGTTTYDGPTRTATFKPTAPLTARTAYTATLSTARDTAGNSIAGPVTWSFTTASAAGASPATIWDTSALPATLDAGDLNAVEVGVKFKATQNGTVRAIRFFKSAANVGAHVGHLWTTDGVLRGTATFTQESGSGWQQAALATPFQVTAGTVYVASVFMPNGHYSSTGAGLAAAVDRPPLRALAAGESGVNGVYRYGPAGGYPTDSWNDTNYWVDVVYEVAADTVGPDVVDRTPAPNLQAVATNTTVTVTFNEAINASTLQLTLKTASNTTVAGTVTYDAGTMTATLTPSSPLTAGATYSASVRAQDSAGNWMPAALTWTFQTAGASMSTIWDSSAVPATPANNDTASVELGVKFRSDVAGAITAIRFYKGTGNTGTHIGRLWSATGDLKGQVTFTSETATGWQQANFATPIPIEANTTYVASYLAPNGRYSSTSAGLASSVDRAPLHALASGGAGGNGVYAYGTGGFPTGSWNSTNYWVDVVFVDTGGPNVSARTPAAGATDVPINTTVTVTFDEPVASGLAMELRDSGGNVVVSNVTYDGATRTATLRPTSNLANAVTYTATVSGAKDAGGNAMSAPVMWSFTTVAAVVTPPPSTALSVFAVDAVPATASVNDPAAVELGMKFRSTVAGTVTGVRFYKGSANTGTHTGRLYSEAGAVLATVVFSGESATGWQTANFSAPVPITPNTTYVIAYHTTSGNYAVTGQFFNPGDVVNGPLIGRANYSNDRNGVYAYGAGGTLPTSSYNGGNYWVDVLFQPSS